MVGMSRSDAVAPRAELARSRLQEAIAVKHRMLEADFADQAVQVACAIMNCLRAGGRVIFFGNGGSAQDAGHLAAELMGRFAFDRPGLAAISLPDATASMTAIGNDYSYDEVFARQVLAVGRPGDVVVGLTTSGNSGNVVNALEAAARAGMITVALTGADGGKAAAAAQIAIRVPTDDTARTQEACLHLGHTICEMVEAALFPRPT
jgi:D-sedoheptulose 7-phosphate isomerase